MTKLLYLLALEGRISDFIYTFYAVNDQEAEEMAKQLELEHNTKRRNLQCFPRGFLIVRSQLPGQIEEEEQ